MLSRNSGFTKTSRFSQIFGKKFISVTSLRIFLLFFWFFYCVCAWFIAIDWYPYCQVYTTFSFFGFFLKFQRKKFLSQKERDLRLVLWICYKSGWMLTIETNFIPPSGPIRSVEFKKKVPKKSVKVIMEPHHDEIKLFHKYKGCSYVYQLSNDTLFIPSSHFIGQ